MACALGAVRRPLVFTDCKSVARTAARLIAQRDAGISPSFPCEHKDLWAFFWSCLGGTDRGHAQVHWIKSHVDYRSVSGVDKIHAWFNHWADKAAKEVLSRHYTPLYKEVLREFHRSMSLAKDLFTFQAGAALIFANDKDSPQVREPVLVGEVTQIGASLSLTFCDELHPVVCHEGFGRSLLNWMRGIRWTPSGFLDGVGPLQDTSWIEMFWVFVHDTSVLPAFLFYHDWVWVQDDPSLEFALPSFHTLFRTWKRTFDAILRSGVSVPWSTHLSKVKSIRTLGARFESSGFNGRISSPPVVLRDLATQFAFVPRFSSLRVPAF